MGKTGEGTNSYYYLRVNEHFYDSEDMKVLQSMRDGYLYSDLLMKMSLISLKNEGRVMFKDDIPYDAEILSTVTGHKIEIVENAIKIFLKFKWIEILDNGAIYMLDIQNHVGRTTNEAQRKREYRKKIENEKLAIKNDGENPEPKCEKFLGEINRNILNDIHEYDTNTNSSNMDCSCENRDYRDLEKFSQYEDETMSYTNKHIDKLKSNEDYELNQNENHGENNIEARCKALEKGDLNPVGQMSGQNEDICPTEKEKEIKTKTETKKKIKCGAEPRTKVNLAKKKNKCEQKSDSTRIKEDEESFAAVLKHFEKCGFIISPRLVEFIQADIKVYGKEYLIEAASICVKRGKLNNYGYLTGIVQNWTTRGYDIKDGWNEHINSHIVNSFGIEKGSHNGKSNNKNNYTSSHISSKINHEAYVPMRSVLDE